MIEPAPSPYLVPFDGSFRVAHAPTDPEGKVPKKKDLEQELEQTIKRMRKLQEKLYADDRYALLLVFQAMDAAGKDGTIKAVMTGVNPAGCQVYSFKRPSAEEYDHDFLWRTAIRLPERGRVGIFNRSYYESVLVVRVHPEFLESEKLPDAASDLERLWEERYASIREHEQHLARNGTVVLKFWLNVSKDEQKARFLDRIEDPSKNWKFSKYDLVERKLWPKYMESYEAALNATSRAHAPWYAIPADEKPYMRLQVASVICDTLERLPIAFPVMAEQEQAQLDRYKAELLAE